jgi:hypothetical protein
MGEMHKMPEIARKMGVRIIYRILVGAGQQQTHTEQTSNRGPSRAQA